MSMELARQDLYGALEAARLAWPDWSLDLQTGNNNLIDISTQEKPYVTSEVVFMGGEQASLGSKPLVATYGHLALGFCIKEAQGTATVYKLADHFARFVEFKDLSVARTRALVPQKSKKDRGWYVLPVLVPFWYHRVAS